ncbi:MAG: hypothetical protein Q9217_005582 [Psora testacea]
MELFTHQLYKWVYNLYLHPLRHIPGRRREAASLALSLYPTTRGKVSWLIHDLHEKYGKIIRIGPDSLSFTDPSVLKELYGHKKDVKDVYAKDESEYLQQEDSMSDIFLCHHGKAAQIRRLLSPAFSDRAIQDAERYIQRYVSLLVSGLRERSAASPFSPNKDRVVNIIAWYQMIMYDLITHFLMSEPLGCLERGSLDPRGENFYLPLKYFLWVANAMRFPPFTKMLEWWIPRNAIERHENHLKYTRDTLRLRLERKDEVANDIVAHLQRNGEKASALSEDEIEQNMRSMLPAGSDLSVRTLGSVTYYLCNYPEACRKLVGEIRGAFATESKITIAETAKLLYLDAVIKESLRMRGPFGGPLPRTVPPGGREIDGVWVPGGTEVAISYLAICRSSRNFTEPNTFVPERWLGDPRFASDQRSVVQPFSIGPRNCIGKGLALAELRVIIARLYWNFDIHLQPNNPSWEDQYEYGIWEVTPLNVKVTDRFDLHSITEPD